MSQQLLFGQQEATAASGAYISPCGKYRYSLWRRWSDEPAVAFIGVNPSTADAVFNDPTITRCIGFAKSWGHGGLVMLNLFAWRSTDQSALRKAADPIGPETDHVLREYADKCSLVVAAWGAIHKSHFQRAAAVCYLLGSPLMCLKLTDKGLPWHPLFVPKDVKPIEYQWKQDQ